MSTESTHRAVGMTRRNALFTGAGAVVAGSAAVAGTRLALGGGDSPADASIAPSAETDVPVMLRLADATKGAFDVYVGTDVVHVVDNGFASLVARAAKAKR